MLKEKKFKKETFMGGWYIDKEICDGLLNFYKLNKDLVEEGCILSHDKSHSIVKKEIKESFDLSISPTYYEGIIGDYRKILSEITRNYIDKYEFSESVPAFGICDKYNIQYYPPGGGFKKWHHETSNIVNNRNRHLVFMTYLNDLSDGGTEFFHQKIKTKAEKGLTLIWPPYWTHTHRGVISKKEKWIVTGWINFIPQNMLGENND